MTGIELEKFWKKAADSSEGRLVMWISLVEENIRMSTDLIGNNRKLHRFNNCNDAEICLALKEIYICFLKNKILENT